MEEAQRVPPPQAAVNTEKPAPPPKKSVKKKDKRPERPERPEPQETLPTDRVSFEKQMQFLQAYAAASESGARGVSNEQVASIVGMKPSTVSLANAFFVKSGFLARSGREYIPSKEVLE